MKLTLNEKYAKLRKDHVKLQKDYAELVKDCANFQIAFIEYKQQVDEFKARFGHMLAAAGEE